MSDDLRVKIRKKIYTSGNFIIDTSNNNNAIIIFLGDKSAKSLKEHIENFLRDTLRYQISENKISFIEVNSNSDNLTEKLSSEITKLQFNPNITNKLFISFVSIMDDEFYKTQYNIDISDIEKLKSSYLGGYSVEFSYDFYGIFMSDAKFSYRENAKKTIVSFLKEENKYINIQKRIYHQYCFGDDYYRSAKSITFSILGNLIEKIDHNMLVNSELDDDGNYRWNTFSLFEKKLESLVIYEIIDSLLDKQEKEAETFSKEDMLREIQLFLNSQEGNMRKISSANDKNYIPVCVKKSEHKLTFFEKFLNFFRKDKIMPVEYSIETESETKSLNYLLEQQENGIKQYLDNTLTEEFINGFIFELIKKCTSLKSVNIKTDSLIFGSLLDIKKDLSTKGKEDDYYIRKYNEIIKNAKITIIDRITEYFEENIQSFQEKVQSNWNKLNQEVDARISEFAQFQEYFNGIDDLISNKNINLLCSFDDILEIINVSEVISEIREDKEIYSKVLESYFNKIKDTCDIITTFGNRPITPDLKDKMYCLFSSSNAIDPPKDLSIAIDDHWFTEYDIAILFIARNKIKDCKNLPFNE